MEVLTMEIKDLLETYGKQEVLKEVVNLFKMDVFSDKISEPSEVIAYLKSAYVGAKYENFIILFLNNQNKVIQAENHSIGTINQSIIQPRRIIASCLEYNSAGIIIAHNHPSGLVYPSMEDINMTKKLKEILLNIDVRLLDHIIISNYEYYSFQEEGVFK